MHVDAILRELVLIAGGAVVAALLLARLKLPIVTGLLIAGALLGPHGLALVNRAEHIDVLAEVGVVLLLFTIGLELSLAQLVKIGKFAALGGGLQVGLTIGATVAIVMAAGGTLQRGLFFGFVVSLSSTAIVLRMLAERAETDAPHGRFIVGALIFQDLCVVPMMLLVPVLAGKGGGSSATATAIALGKAGAVVAATIVLSRWLTPRLFALVDRARSRELFVLTLLVVCLGTAWLTSLIGLSLALGAFLAGVVLADSDYAHRAMAEVLPLRDLLTSVFFVSLGMFFDVRVLLEQPLLVAGLFFAMLVGKAAIASLAGMAMRFPANVAVLAGIGLAQFSEFGFILGRAGSDAGLLSPAESKVLMAAAVSTMLVTPLAMSVAPRIAAGTHVLRTLERMLGARGIDDPAPEHAKLSDHVVIVGYGVAGQVLARALHDAEIPYIILEINAETVRRARAAGEPAYYGDVAAPEALEHAHARQARALVLLINDPRAAERAAAVARHHAPTTPVFVRTHYLANAATLTRLGATDVVVEETEAGLEMLARVLRHAGVPLNVIAARLEDARVVTMASTRPETTQPRRQLGVMPELADLKVESYAVMAGGAAAGRSVTQLRLRSRTGALAIAVRRAGRLDEQFDPALPFEVGDVVFLAGTREAVAAAIAVLDEGSVPSSPASPDQPASSVENPA